MPTNVLTQVITYQRSNLAFLRTSYAFISDANKKFKNFEKMTGNLGDTVSWDLPPRYTTTASLVASFQPSTQRIATLTVDQPVSVSYAFNVQQFIFNVKEYMSVFGKAAVIRLGNKVEAYMAGFCETKPYRFYGDGVTAINSFGQLGSALAYFRDAGYADSNIRGYLPTTVVPTIVNTGLSQFVIDRNEQMASSWKLGRFGKCEWRETSFLPLHVSGTVGNGATAAIQTLTVVSVDDATGNAVTQITCTCDASLSGSATAILAHDRGVFLDGVAGQSNIRYLVANSDVVSSNPVQIRMTSSAAASGTTVVLSVDPTLCWVAANANCNLSVPIAAGMKIKIMPSHRVGMIYSGDALFLGMPQLPEEVPFPTANEADADTGVSMRMYYGSLFGQNQRGFVHDAIYGGTLMGEYSMALLFPVTQ